MISDEEFIRKYCEHCWFNDNCDEGIEKCMNREREKILEEKNISESMYVLITINDSLQDLVMAVRDMNKIISKL